jgi:amidase
VGGLPTTVGTFAQLLSKDAALPVSPIDATVVRRLLEAGATIKGTATCENYSLCPLSYSAASGPVHNPWLRGYNVGGSSSGPGALVAAATMAIHNDSDMAGIVDLAIGGDQGGSIRLPAAYGGLYGLKPTHGLIPYTGTAALVPMLDHVGPMATNVHDIALLLQVLAGFDGIDQRMTAEAPLRDQVKDYPGLVQTFMNAQSHSTGKILRIGILEEGFKAPGLTASVRDTVRTAAVDFFSKAGMQVNSVSIPMHSLGPAIWTAATRASMADFAFRGQVPGHLSYAPPHIQTRWPPDQEMFDLLTATNPAVVNVALSGPALKSKFGAHAEAKAHRKIYELRAAYDKAFEEYDILVTPTVPTVAMPHPKLKFTDGEGSSVMEKLSLSIGSTSNTCPFNATGHPAISVPCGFARPEQHPAAGELPVGMQLIARRWDDETLLMAAAVFEAAQAGDLPGRDVGA